MRPWRIGRAVKPHDYTRWLRGSLKAHPCTCSELAESIRPPCGHFRTHLASPKRDEGQRHAASLRKAVALRRLLRLLIYPPFPVGECWAEKPLAVRVRDRADWVAGAGMRLQRNPTSARAPVRRSRMGDRRGAHLWPTFLCEEKDGAAGGSPAKRLSRLATASSYEKRHEGRTLIRRCAPPSRVRRWEYSTPQAKTERSHGATPRADFRATKSSGKWLSALNTGNGISPPNAHNEPWVMVSQRLRSSTS